MEPWQRVDGGPDEEAGALLRACCGSSRWVSRMVARRPFRSTPVLLAAARDIWFGLDPDDWHEAFSQHPKIGDREALRARFPETRALAAREQSGVAGASGEVLEALAEANAAYERRFGYIFIVCATGRSAPEMLDLLRARLRNDPAIELRTAAGEQAKITELRLQRLT